MREGEDAELVISAVFVADQRRLQEIFGGNAVSDEYGIGRHVANLFVTQTYEGQSDIHSKSIQRLAGHQ